MYLHLYLYTFTVKINTASLGIFTLFILCHGGHEVKRNCTGCLKKKGNPTIGRPETRVFILVALARVN